MYSKLKARGFWIITKANLTEQQSSLKQDSPLTKQDNDVSSKNVGVHISMGRYSIFNPYHLEVYPIFILSVIVFSEFCRSYENFIYITAYRMITLVTSLVKLVM